MNHDLTTSEVKAIASVLREHGGPEARLVANKIEGNDLRGSLLRYDPPEDFKAYILLMSSYLRHQFFLNSWTGHYEFKHLDSKDDTEDCVTAASTYLNHVYEYYCITIGYSLLGAWQAGQYERIGDDLCHELTHVLLGEVTGLAKAEVTDAQAGFVENICERVVQRTSRIIGSSLPDGWWAPEYLEKWESGVSCNKTCATAKPKAIDPPDGIEKVRWAANLQGEYGWDQNAGCIRGPFHRSGMFNGWIVRPAAGVEFRAYSDGSIQAVRAGE